MTRKEIIAMLALIILMFATGLLARMNPGSIVATAIFAVVALLNFIGAFAGFARSFDRFIESDNRKITRQVKHE